MSEHEISPEALDAAFGRLQQEISRRVHAPPVSTLIKNSRARTRRRLGLAATASIAAALATVLLLLPDDEVNPAPVKPASLELSVPLVDGEPAALPPGPDVASGAEVPVEVTVTNTGEQQLEDVAGEAGGNLTCGATQLDPGASTTCSTTVSPGARQHHFELRVTATYSGDKMVSDRITVFYRGTPPPRALVDLSNPTVNEQSAGRAPGPTVPTEDLALVGVRVSNDGDLPLTQLAAIVTEDGRALACDQTRLAPGQNTTCEGVAGLDVGPNEVDVEVTATDSAGDAVRDTITAHYAGLPPQAPADAFLTADDANVVLGSWTGDTFRTAGSPPSSLEFQGSCTPDPLPYASENVLVDGQNGAVITTIAVLPTDNDAQQATAGLIGQVSGCVDARPARDQVFDGLPVSSATGTAQSFGVDVGSGRAAHQYEYIVVARDGAAVGVSTFAVFAQDTLSEATMDDLAGRVLDRLGAAS